MDIAVSGYHKSPQSDTPNLAAALKLAMNQLIAGLTASFALSLGLVRREGIEVGLFMDLLRGSALHAPTFDKKLDKYLSHDYGAANFPLKHLLKDVRLFRRVAEQSGLDRDLIGALEALCARAEDEGFGEQDYSALYEAVCPPLDPPSSPSSGPAASAPTGEGDGERQT